MAFEKRDPMESLPHRDIALPFEEYEFDPATGEVRVKMAFGNPYTQGHFPGKPLVPGHWSVETMALAAGLGAADDIQASGKIPVLLGFNGAKFSQPIKPGEEVEVRGHLTRQSSRVIRGAGAISLANGEQAASLDEFTVILVDKDKVDN